MIKKKRQGMCCLCEAGSHFRGGRGSLSMKLVNLCKNQAMSHGNPATSKITFYVVSFMDQDKQAFPFRCLLFLLDL